MTDRNDESLSTRDLASPSDPTAGAVASPEPGAPPSESQSSDQAPQHDPEMLAPAHEAESTASAPDVQAPPPLVETSRERSERDERSAPTASEEPPESRRSTVEAEERGVDTGASEPLLPFESSVDFQRRWEGVQTRFVDEPRGAVEDADGLVAELMQQLAEGFAQERELLEAQWGRGEDISTEDLRVALQRYRSFFQRLLST